MAEPREIIARPPRDSRLRFGQGLRRILNRLVTASFGSRAFGCLVFPILVLLVGLTGRAEAAALVPVSIVVSSGEIAHNSECVSKSIYGYGVTLGSASMDANSLLKGLAPTRSLCSQNCGRNAFDATARIVAEQHGEGVVASRQFRFDALHRSRVSRSLMATKALPDPVAEAQAAAAKIRGGGGKTPTMTSAAVDSSTGKVYTGTSGYNGSVPPEINVPNPSKTPWSAANCVDVAACSAAIADGAKLENLQVAIVRTRTGVVAPPCPNCQTWVPGKKP